MESRTDRCHGATALTARPDDDDESRFSGVSLMARMCHWPKTRAPRDYNVRWDDNGRLLSDLPNVPFLVEPCKLDNGLSDRLLHV
jgi:hypothetical protein